VGIRFGMCSQFLVFDLDTLEYLVLSVPPHQETPEQVSLTAISGAGRAGCLYSDHRPDQECLPPDAGGPGYRVIDGVEKMTVHEAIELYRAPGCRSALRRGTVARIAVVARGEGLDARLEVPMERCTSFIVVIPLPVNGRPSWSCTTGRCRT